jgi:hypothetical protein
MYTAEERYEEVEVELHEFLILALEGDELSSSRLERFIPMKERPVAKNKALGRVSGNEILTTELSEIRYQTLHV